MAGSPVPAPAEVTVLAMKVRDIIKLFEALNYVVVA
jgi:hypothetical protein